MANRLSKHNSGCSFGDLLLWSGHVGHGFLVNGGIDIPVPGRLSTPGSAPRLPRKNAMDGIKMPGDWQAFIVPDSAAVLWWSFLTEQRSPKSRKQHTDHELGLTTAVVREQPRVRLVSIDERLSRSDMNLRVVLPRIEVEFGYDTAQESVVEGNSVRRVQTTELPCLGSFSGAQVKEEVIHVGGIKYSVVVGHPRPWEILFSFIGGLLISTCDTPTEPSFLAPHSQSGLSGHSYRIDHPIVDSFVYRASFPRFNSYLPQSAPSYSGL